ncbi:unnamed protein product [Amoebophrya sp. A120]|nr:unnamed protein product [Amoebophrya sp. A120]|eukprot:GSA120T00021905001.1
MLSATVPNAKTKKHKSPRISIESEQQQRTVLVEVYGETSPQAQQQDQRIQQAAAIHPQRSPSKQTTTAKDYQSKQSRDLEDGRG